MKREDTLINQEFVERGQGDADRYHTAEACCGVCRTSGGNGIFTIDGMETAERTLRQIRQSVKEREPDSVYLQSSSRLVCAVPERSDEQMRRFALQIKESVSKDGCSASQPESTMAVIPYTQIGTAEQKASKSTSGMSWEREEGHLFLP